MYKILDNYGISYYLRGAKTYIPNNIIFAGFQWKIVRINGDGSLRLIYNGTCPGDSCTINSTGTATLIGTSAFGYHSGDNKRLGYMFSPYGAPASTSRAMAVTNEIDSVMKEALDNWYSNNILGSDYEDTISDTLFCNDRRLRSEVGGSSTGGGYGDLDTYYAAYQRLDATKAPDIRCVQNDRFTASDVSIGNGALTYPIGLLTADETSLAGLHRTIDNTTNYLHVNHDWWTMSPGYFQGGTTDIAKAFGIVDTSKIVSILYVTDVRGVRPVINLKPDVKAIGTGTAIDPYKVQVDQNESNLGNKIIAEYDGVENITTAPAGTFANINGSTDNLMYKMDDDYGTSYYLRGAKDYMNNNLIFAEYQWKVVRINGNGTIKIIYNGTCPNGSCTINSTGTSTQIGTAVFQGNAGDNKYLGYMYSPSGTTSSTSRAQAVTNVTSSNMKTTLDTWYSTNILGTDYEDYISDTLFCNDRQLRSEVGGSSTGTGYGSNSTYYAAYQRLVTTKSPNLQCGLQNDRFTVSDASRGNGASTYPIGLITADESALAGMVRSLSNTTNYLSTGQKFSTISPSNTSYILSVGGTGGLYIDLVSDSLAVRPVINLKSNTEVTGTGTTTDPYIVQ